MHVYIQYDMTCDPTWHITASYGLGYDSLGYYDNSSPVSYERVYIHRWKRNPRPSHQKFSKLVL